MSCNSDFHIIIPARYQSSRLPGKLLMDIHGMTVIERVYRQAIQSQAKTVTIATDNQEIYDLAQKFGASVIMTAKTHQTGTDRIAEAITLLGFSSDEIIVNVQGDEPFISPALITQAANSLLNTDAPMATLCWPIENYAMYTNPNVVKVVRDCNQHALYFSRSAIPANRDMPTNIQHVFRHIGLYAYRADFLLKFVTWPVCELEEIEALEQLRVMWAGYKIKVEEACVRPLQDINTSEDLEEARNSVVS
jgi:3-deoxy-manno-octulosonate cytidylyltransferase (CMP-KDO synthetase)